MAERCVGGYQCEKCRKDLWKKSLSCTFLVLVVWRRTHIAFILFASLSANIQEQNGAKILGLQWLQHFAIQCDAAREEWNI